MSNSIEMTWHSDDCSSVTTDGIWPCDCGFSKRGDSLAQRNRRAVSDYRKRVAQFSDGRQFPDARDRHLQAMGRAIEAQFVFGWLRLMERAESAVRRRVRS